MLSWSDGEWVLVHLAMTSRTLAEVPALQFPCFVEQTASPFARGRCLSSEAIRAGCQVVLRPVERFRADLLADASWQPVHERGAPLPSLPDAVTALAAGLPSDTRLALLDGESWADGAAGEIPGRVAPYLNVAPQTRSWCVRSCGGAESDEGCAGLLEAPGTGEAPRIVQWKLTDGHLAITAVERGLGGCQPECRPGLLQRRAVAKDLRDLLGGYGASLGLVAAAVDEGPGPRGFLLTPAPDTPFGLYGESTVGEQPWGRCIIYAAPAILHVVFDLTEEEGE